MEPAKRVIHHVGVSQRGTIMSALAPTDHAGATCFEEYVRTAQFVPFMRDVLRVIEEERSDIAVSPERGEAVSSCYYNTRL